MLTLTRTANAGVLLCMDGKRILLDGVCREVTPYLATPSHVRTGLEYPDIVAVTHRHDDHCDPVFEAKFSITTGRPLIDPSWEGESLGLDNLTVYPVPSRHLGRTDVAHVSYILQGSRCVWFMGDAAPEQFKNRTDLPKPDVLIAPYAFASTAYAWRITRSLGATYVVLLHLPDRQQDSFGLWDAVKQTVGENQGIFIPEMEEFIEFSF